jgi:lysophospholipase L1-like esterase
MAAQAAHVLPQNPIREMRVMACVPNLVLIGDSIRMGYRDEVGRILDGVSRVQSPKQHGGNSRNLLAHLDEWTQPHAPAVVHINCGLHDLRRELNSPLHAVEPQEYGDNVRTILTRLLDGGWMRVVWATTTPVNEGWHHATKGFDRFEADVAQYNELATAVAADLGVAVNDLNAVVTSAGRDALLLDDGVHFKPEGSALLGAAVARFVEPFLD